VGETGQLEALRIVCVNVGLDTKAGIRYIDTIGIEFQKKRKEDFGMSGIYRSIKKGSLRYLLYLVLVSVSILGLVPRVSNAVVVANPEGSAQVDRAQDMAKIRSALERKEVASRLQAMGLSTEDIEKRLSVLSDDDIHKIATNLDSVNAGSGALETILVLLVIAGLVILILWLVGVIDFDKAKKKKPSN